MKTEYKRRRNIERATSFKVQYSDSLDVANPLEREFDSQKSMAQWIGRQESSGNFGFMTLKRLALIDGIWEPFAIIGKLSITLSDLEDHANRLREEYKHSKPTN